MTEPERRVEGGQSASPDFALLDTAAVNQLRALDSEGTLLRELIAEFRKDVARFGADVSRAAREAEQAPICAAAHSLKGASASLGLAGLTRVFLEIEQLAEARRFDLIGPKLTQLQAGVEVGIAALESAVRGAG